MLIHHIAQNDKVLIQVDSDCDGFTSAAVLINYLNCLFPAFVQNNILYRIHEGKEHGIIPDTIPKGVKLIIAPDSSSNNFYEHEYLKTVLEIDVLVIDHHEADKISSYACVINNQLCNYPTKSLSGVGMVYKFCSMIDQIMEVNYANLFLDLVSLGMVADMMDLRDFETRHLVMKGLNQIRNPYFKGMVEKQSYSLKDGLSPFGIAFYIAPYVNATIRVGTQNEKLMLFESMLDYRGYELVPSTKRGCKGQVETRVEQACRNCTNIKNRQTKARDASLNTIEQIIKSQNLLENKLLIIKLDQDQAINKNLTGLIANELASKYQRPTLLLNMVIHTNIIQTPISNYEKWLQDKGYIKPSDFEDGEITWEGSGRGYDKSKFDNFKEFLNNSGYVMYAEGHANAFGVGIKDKDFNTLISYSNEALKDFDFTPCYKVDFIFHINDIDIYDILKLAELKTVWGQGVDEPLIAIEGINIHNGSITLMSKDKHPTLKITLPNGMSLIKFGSSEEEYNNLYSDLGCVKINIVGKCERNIWNGMISPQIIIEEYEVIERTQYYF